MYYLLFALFALLGGLLSCFTLLPVGVIIFFGIPFTRDLEKSNGPNGLKVGNGIVKRYLLSLLLLSAIYASIFYCVQHFFPTHVFAFILGSIWPLITGSGKFGMNKANLQDYLTSNRDRFVHPESVDLSLTKNSIKPSSN